MCGGQQLDVALVNALLRLQSIVNLVHPPPKANQGCCLGTLKMILVTRDRTRRDVNNSSWMAILRGTGILVPTLPLPGGRARVTGVENRNAKMITGRLAG